jgi:Ca2+/Na+ antiporter
VADMTDNIEYHEEISSNKTEILFLALTILFFLLLTWRWIISGLDTLAIIFLGLVVLFIFYSLNYRTLKIHLKHVSLELKFGIFTWKIPFDNIESCRLDDNLSALMKNGGAGIHFMTVDHRYRASFNFLEYPRVVIALKKKAGLVRDISFSTRRPEEVLSLIEKGVSSIRTTKNEV